MTLFYPMNLSHLSYTNIVFIFNFLSTKTIIYFFRDLFNSCQVKFKQRLIFEFLLFDFYEFYILKMSTNGKTNYS